MRNIFILIAIVLSLTANAADSLTIISMSKQQGMSMLTHNVSVPTGTLIVISTGYAGNLKNCTVTITPTLVLKRVANAELAGSGDAEIYEAVSTAGGSYKITTSFGSGFQTSVVYAITGYETSLSGAAAVSVKLANPSVNITTTKANSLLIAVTADFNGRDGSGRMYRDQATEQYYQRATNKEGTNYHYVKQATTIKQYTEGLTSPGSMAAGTAIVEIRAGNTVTVPDTQPPTSPSLNVTSTTTNTVSLTWTTATDNVRVVGYDIYVDGILKTTVTGTSYTLTGLKEITQYSIFVEAKDAAGNVGRSNVVTATTKPIPNQSPVARAGNDISMTLPVNSTTLNGSGSSDPDGTIAGYLWTYLSGPAQWSISDPNAVSTSLNSLVAGGYIFRLQVTDNQGATAIDDIVITVNSQVPVDSSAITLAGFGSQAVGGSNSSTIYHVTNTSSSGSGSLANGIGSNKTIVFDVSGTITGRFDLVNISYLTIDGGNQTIIINNQNNGDGVSFDGSSTHHCILKNIEVTNAGGDGINVINGAHDILISNCYSHGNRDGNIDIAGDNSGLTKNVTVQWSVMGEGAANNTSYSGDHLITGQSVSSHHNLFLPATVGGVGERCPLVHCNYSPVGSPNADVRYNTIWRFGRDNGTGSGFGIDVAYGAAGNAVGNYVYTTGGSNSNGVTVSAYGEPSGNMYASGNISGNSGTNPNGESNHAEYTIPPAAQINVAGGATACSEAKRVIAKAGPVKRSSGLQSAINAIPITLPGCPAQ